MSRNPHGIRKLEPGEEPEVEQIKVFLGNCKLDPDELRMIRELFEIIGTDLNNAAIGGNFNPISRAADSHAMFHFILTAMKDFDSRNKENPLKWPEKWPKTRKENEAMGRAEDGIGELFDFAIMMFAAGIRWREVISISAMEELRDKAMRSVRL